MCIAWHAHAFWHVRPDGYFGCTMHTYCTAAHAQPADMHRQRNTACLTGAWSVPNFEWGSPNNCPPNNLQPGQAFLVGRTMFETDRLSPERERRCNAMDEIWVPTEFHRQVFADSGVKANK